MHDIVLMPWPSSRTRITPFQPWPALLVACTLLGVTCLRELSTLHAAAADITELWQEPARLEQYDLSVGPWGRENAPDTSVTYTFVEPKQSGTSPGLTVDDPRGRRWHIKEGREAKPEVLVSHVLSALGYHQPPVYYVPRLRVLRGSQVVELEGGRFRLNLPSLQRKGPWRWRNNPLGDTVPYRGLLVILVMLNSADLKDSNNSIYEWAAPDGQLQQWYVVRDLGTSLGATNYYDPTPNLPDVFERHAFITGVKHGYVAFDYLARNGDLVRHRITPEDVRWASRLAGRLTEAQWNDAFRGAGYEPAVAERFIRRLQQKIREGAALTGTNG
jgi:hypothetical protein